MSATGSERFTDSDAPTADVPDEDVVAFLDELNTRINDDREAVGLGPTTGFSTAPVTRDSAPHSRTAVDPADPPDLLTHARIRVVDAYEACIDAEELVAAAALRRRDGLDDQGELVRRVRQFVLADEGS